MHQTQLLFVIALVALLGVATVAAKGKRKPTQIGPMKPKRVMTPNEQAMYWRLRETFPDAVVLAQVAFSALITTKAQHDRNRFDRKIADFVLCDRGMNVQAVIELDDSSHRGREADDAKRAALLTSAGYRVLRFPRVPDIAALRDQIVTPTPTAPPVAKSP